MHSKSNNIELMIYDNTGELVEKLLGSHVNRYWIGLETSMRGSDLIFDCVDLLHYRYHEINPNSGGWYKDSPAWVKSKSGTIKKI